MNRMHLYCRVSTDAQVERGALDNQILWSHQTWDQILAKPQYERFSKGEAFVDEGESAYFIPLLQRTAGRRLDTTLQWGDAVLLANGDRGFRRSLDWEVTNANLAQRGILIIPADMPDLDPREPMGKFVCSLRYAAAELESALKSQRIRKGMSVCKARNQCMSDKGRRPGWKIVAVPFQNAGPLVAGQAKYRGRRSTLVWQPNPAEFWILERIYQLRTTANMTWDAISLEIVKLTGDTWWRPEAFPGSLSKVSLNGGRNCRWAYLVWQQFAAAIAAYGKVEQVQSLSRQEMFAADRECQRQPNRGPRKKLLAKIGPDIGVA